MIKFLTLIYQSCTGCIASGCTPPGCAGRCGCGGEEPPAAPIDQLLIAFLIIGTILGIWYIWNKNSENS